jgi:hypothetical protein
MGFAQPTRRDGMLVENRRPSTLPPVPSGTECEILMVDGVYQGIADRRFALSAMTEG